MGSALAAARAPGDDGPGGRAAGSRSSAPAPSAAASPAPTPPTAPASPAVPAAGTATLVLETGERIAVAGDGVLLGRAPARARGDAELLPVPIADTTKSVSKTHVAVHRIDGVWAAEDRHSTNGSAIVRDGTQHELLPGRPLPLRDGDELRFGDRRARFQTD
ncbi:FHA domain-containing protein [Microbacterium elymi]|uniref:FHA domain-containing protein n=1 Tax=Microbacterium elymi TaxID=2909587 RepID=A0ABY5NL06_9MICO|nr:FHA domain-containing protein [Microbacterium elymi]UUT35837.1 FHA domain-containing protein [Microbacterium elymi]